MARKPNVLCIDIGADTLKAAEFSYSQEGSMELVNFAFTEFGYTDAASLEKAIEPILVSQAVGSVEENLKKIQRKQYEQQNVIDVMAKVLYYKKELEDLQETMSQISAASSSPDSAGAVAVPAEFMAVKNKIKALQMKITATRQTLKGMQGQMSAEPLKEPIVSML